jgi:hypothetical protein
MPAVFPLDALEQYLRLTALTGDRLEVETHLARGGAVILTAARIHNGAAIEVKRFHVRGHSAVEVDVQDRRYRPAAGLIAEDAPAAQE